MSRPLRRLSSLSLQNAYLLWLTNLSPFFHSFFLSFFTSFSFFLSFQIFLLFHIIPFFSLGVIISYFVSDAFVRAGEWRHTFFAFGALGMVWCMLWYSVTMRRFPVSATPLCLPATMSTTLCRCVPNCVLLAVRQCLSSEKEPSADEFFLLPLPMDSRKDASKGSLPSDTTINPEQSPEPGSVADPVSAPSTTASPRLAEATDLGPADSTSSGTRFESRRGERPAEQLPTLQALRLAWRLFKHPLCRPAYVAHFAHAAASFIAFAWLPSYYADLEADVSSDALAAFLRGVAAVAPYVVMVACALGGSIVADRMLKRGVNRTCKREV